MIRLDDVLEARARIGGSVDTSPCARTWTLSERAGCEVHLKLENLQRTGSFKERGACNRLVSLDATTRSRGVVAASAGNHAQGVAFHARRLGIRALVVMPEGTPLVKVAATRAFGAEVRLEGQTYDEAYAVARGIADAEGRALVHPFDDDAIMAGQGTLGLEILEQVPDVDAIVVPVGGGGLLAGVAVAVKEQRPQVQIYGVEPSAAPSMTRALAEGRPVEVPVERTIADGVAVARVGDRTFEVARRYLDGMVTVDEEAIAQSILDLLEREKTVAEGAGAAPVAALLERSLPVDGRRVVAILSGGNIDVNLVSRVIDQGLSRSGRLMRLRVLVPDRPGVLVSLLEVIAAQRANVLQIAHDRIGGWGSTGEVPVEMVLETRGFDHVRAIEEAIRGAGHRLE